MAKVDELMALCDETETRLRRAEEVGRSLLESIVHSLTRSSAA